MIISVTERGSFKRCRRQWDFGSFSRQGLEPVINKPALVLGGIVHKTMELWTQRPDEEPDQVFLGVANEALDKTKADYKARIGAEVSESELQDTYDALHLGMQMVKRYKLRWGSPTPDGYTLVQTEQTCLVPIADTGHWECNICHQVYDIFDLPSQSPAPSDLRLTCYECPDLPRSVTWQQSLLEGTLDGLLEDHLGALWVLERKTYGNRPNLGKLQMEDQFLAYCWMLRKLFPDRRLGGVLYDGMWKRDEKPLEECFQRYPLLREDAEIEEFEQHLTLETQDMMQPRIYINRRWEGCTDCMFERLCTAVSRGEDADYIKETYYKPRSSGVKVELEV